jgi:hypothetical protein
VTGAIVAVLAVVARRISALLAIVILLGLVLVLMWRVYVHHRSLRERDETVIVSLDAPPSASVEKITR